MFFILIAVFKIQVLVRFAPILVVATLLYFGWVTVRGVSNSVPNLKKKEQEEINNK